MSNTPHTPGPWELLPGVKPEDWENLIIWAPDAGIILNGTAQNDADIPLILAAPELLEALRGVIRVADRSTAEFDAARAAIAKATGEAP